LACSGATAGSADAPGLRSFRRQVSGALARLTSRPALVSITIGINDLEWSDIPRTYVRLREPGPLFDSWLAGKAEDIERALRTELSRLLARRSVRIALTEYFNPVNQESILFGGPAPCLDVAACLSRANALVDTVNVTLREAVRGLRHRARVRIVAVRAAFEGHESPSPACGSAPPAVAATWIQHPDDPLSNSFPLRDFPELAPLLGSDWRGDCFHPNDTGAAFIAGAVDRAARRLGR
jgi:lysophospholipase L1-like esterase